jgi:hypothetical protein
MTLGLDSIGEKMNYRFVPTSSFPIIDTLMTTIDEERAAFVL